MLRVLSYELIIRGAEKKIGGVWTVRRNGNLAESQAFGWGSKCKT
jgi:hypothetical protein